MRRLTYKIFSVSFILIILFGCSSKENNSQEPIIVPVSEQLDYVSEEMLVEEDLLVEKLLPDQEIKLVTISNLNGGKEVSIDEAELLEWFESLFSSAVKEAGIVNMGASELRMHVEFESNQRQSFNLWLGDEGQVSSLMKVEDSQTLYSISAEHNEKLLELVDSIFS